MINQNIYSFLDTLSLNSAKSKNEYEKLHTKKFSPPKDGSYDVLEHIARGNETIDIACGDGELLEKNPNIVGVEFSINALKKAKKRGGKYLIQADAHLLPFKNKSFDVCICNGSLEHFDDPDDALSEIARISKFQVLTIHRQLSFPAYNFLRKILLKLKNTKDQPIETPLSWKTIKNLYKKNNLHIIYHGLWTYPVNVEIVHPLFSKHLNIPSCYFIISKSPR